MLTNFNNYQKFPPKKSKKFTRLRKRRSSMQLNIMNRLRRKKPIKMPRIVGGHLRKRSALPPLKVTNLRNRLNQNPIPQINNRDQKNGSQTTRIKRKNLQVQIPKSNFIPFERYTKNLTSRRQKSAFAGQDGLKLKIPPDPPKKSKSNAESPKKAFLKKLQNYATKAGTKNPNLRPKMNLQKKSEKILRDKILKQQCLMEIYQYQPLSIQQKFYKQKLEEREGKFKNRQRKLLYQALQPSTKMIKYELYGGQSKKSNQAKNVFQTQSFDRRSSINSYLGSLMKQRSENLLTGSNSENPKNNEKEIQTSQALPSQKSILDSKFMELFKYRQEKIQREEEERLRELILEEERLKELQRKLEEEEKQNRRKIYCITKSPKKEVETEKQANTTTASKFVKTQVHKMHCILSPEGKLLENKS